MLQVIDTIASRSAFSRLGEPDEIADAIAYLVGPDAKWVAGTTLFCDGALTI